MYYLLNATAQYIQHGCTITPLTSPILSTIWKSKSIMFFLALFVIFKTVVSDCNYISFAVNGTEAADYIAPNACYQFRENGVITSAQFKCSSDGKSIIGETYFKKNDCSGNPDNTTHFNSSVISNFKCDGSDCSSVYRMYDNCNDINNADFTSLPIVVGMCSSYNGVSSVWKCTESQEIWDVYTKSDCSGNSIPITYGGCQNGIYYQIMTCN